MESPDAGDPSRLIRLRYREAAEMIKVRGKICVMLINDLDAGVGRMDGISTTEISQFIDKFPQQSIYSRSCDFSRQGCLQIMV